MKFTRLAFTSPPRLSGKINKILIQFEVIEVTTYLLDFGLLCLCDVWQIVFILRPLAQMFALGITWLIREFMGRTRARED